MPTIAEIIAAKKAATAGPIAGPKGNLTNDLPLVAGEVAPIETITERVATKEAIDRIDPPGKPMAAATARKASGLILNKDMPTSHPNGEPRGQATPILGPEDNRRSLSETAGEGIDLTPQTASEAEKAWHAALNAFESELCVMRDPKDPERAWIAVRIDGQEQWPILLKSFPIYDHPRAVCPPNEPF